MNRVQCINTLKEGAALSAVDAAIEAIRDHQERWGHVNEPEEDAFARAILGSLIELQVRSVEQSIRLGEAMCQRLAAAEKEAA